LGTNNPSKIKVGSYIGRNLYDKIFRDLKERWEEATGQEIKDSPFLAMIIREGERLFRKKVENLEGRSPKTSSS